MTAELNKWRRIFTGLASPSEVIYSQIPTLSIVYIQISNTYLPEFLNILLYVEASPVQICPYCLYSAVIFNSKLDYWKTHWLHQYEEW